MDNVDSHLLFPERKVAKLAKSACDGSPDDVVGLLREGVPVNAVGEWGVTPLGYAVTCNSLEGVEALLDAGADPNSRGDLGTTPVWTAALLGEPEVLQALLDRGGDFDVADSSGSTALMRAFDRGVRSDTGHDWSNYYLLLERGANINQADELGFTLASHAAASGRFDKVVELLELGYSYDLLGVAWSAEQLAVSADRRMAQERVKVLLKERGVQWPIPHPLSDRARAAYMQAHPDYAEAHPESWPRSEVRGMDSTSE